MGFSDFSLNPPSFAAASHHVKSHGDKRRLT